LYPIGTGSPLSRNLNAIRLFFILFCMALCQKVVFVALSMAIASSTVCGTLIPNF
jgi:hypothetical protein